MLETFISNGVCWDEKVKIGLIPADQCRSIYINFTFKSLLLLLVLFAVLNSFIKPLFGLLNDYSYSLSLKSGGELSIEGLGSTKPRSADDQKRVVSGAARLWFWLGTSRLARTAGAGFANFYSGYILFMYMNDNFMQLLIVQATLSLQQLYLFLYTSALFDRRSDSYRTALMYPELADSAVDSVTNWSILPGIAGKSFTRVAGSVALGMLLFKILFNVILESTCSYGTNIFRTFMFVLSDIVDVVIIIGIDGSSKSAARVFSSHIDDENATDSGSEKSDKVVKSNLPTYIRNGLYGVIQRIRGIAVNNKVEKMHLIKHTVIMTGTCAILYAIMFGLLAITGQRLC